jgi:hypothetical protein
MVDHGLVGANRGQDADHHGRGAKAGRSAGEGLPWRLWSRYLSERQWGTVRADYSPDGNASEYFTHDEARSRAYHWGEDGLAGLSDDHQRLCFALACGTARVRYSIAGIRADQ